MGQNVDDADGHNLVINEVVPVEGTAKTVADQRILEQSIKMSLIYCIKKSRLGHLSGSGAKLCAGCSAHSFVDRIMKLSSHIYVHVTARFASRASPSTSTKTPT